MKRLTRHLDRNPLLAVVLGLLASFVILYFNGSSL